VCGRYTLSTPGEEVAELFALASAPRLEPRYNIAPTQQVAVVRAAGGDRELVLLRWGLIPSWAKDEKIGYRMINARSETVAAKPSFRAAFAARRCLLVADGFYEWQRVGKTKQPFHMRMKDERPFGIAGLWELWRKGERPIESCALITTAANRQLAAIHPRMPAILAPEQFDAWLDPHERDASTLAAMLQPYDSEALESLPVGQAVNNPRNQGPECIEPLPP
jgi:putative SOS response-associated peptidase YedK